MASPAENVNGITIAWIGVISVSVTAVFAFISKLIERGGGRESKLIEDTTKLRSELFERIKHLEGRIDQVNADKEQFLRENAMLQVRLEKYQEDIEELKREMNEREEEYKRRETEFEGLKMALEAKIRELERQIAELEAKKGADYGAAGK